MELDINTPKGQITLEQERKAIDRIKLKWNVDIIETDKKEISCFDNIILKDNTIKAITEFKCRNMTMQQMRDWGDSWLVTNQKIKDCTTVSGLMRVPFIGILYLVPEDLILYWKITNKYGKYLFPFEIKETKTQYSVNGGETVRENAYLSTKFSKRL
jgi:hypothetical protein